MLKEGVRQGCPLSTYLFILCMEVFAEKNLANNLIRDVKLSNRETKLLQYADDTTLFLDGTEGSSKEAIHVLAKASTLLQT